MSLPLRSILGYAWERATFQKRVYSHVLEKHDAANHFHMSVWMRATPIGNGKYKVDECAHWIHSGELHTTVKQYPYESDYTGLLSAFAAMDAEEGKPVDDGTYTRDEVLQIIKEHEAEWLEKGSTASPRQLFKAYIKTSL